MPIINKMNVKQIAKLKTPGIYSDGGGLYLRIRPSLAKPSATRTPMARRSLQSRGSSSTAVATRRNGSS